MVGSVDVAVNDGLLEGERVGKSVGHEVVGSYVIDIEKDIEKVGFIDGKGLGTSCA